MKKIILLLLAISFQTILIAQQMPQGMQYQAVARDLEGNILANRNINLRISLLTSENEGQKTYYSEVHNAQTSQLGIFNLVVGEGRTVDGSFDRIPWSSERIWMELAIDERGGHNFQVINTSRLYAVPYAFHAGSADVLLDENQYIGRANKPGVPANNWHLKGNRSSDPTVDKLGTTDCADLVIVTDNEERMRILCSGQVLIDGSLDVGADLTVQQNVEVNIMGGTTTVHGDFSVVDGSNTHLTGNLVVDGTTNLNSSLDVNNNSPTNLTGTLNVDGTTNLNSSLDVNNNSPTNLTGTLNVDGTTNLNSSLDVNNNSPTNLTGILNVDGSTTINNSFDVTNNSPTYLTGILTVDGITSINNNFQVLNNSTSLFTGPTNIQNTLNVTNNATFNNNLSVTNCLQSGSADRVLLKFNPNIVNSAEGSFDNYPLQFSGNGASQGMAIRLNQWVIDKNFMAFFADGEMRGRIEGKTAFLFSASTSANALLDYDPNDAQGQAGGADSTVNASGAVADAGDDPVPSTAITVPVANTEEIVELIILAVDFIGAVIEVASSFTSIPFDPVDIFEAALGAIVAGADLGVFIGFGIANVGVAYESGSGDYAEYLLKHNLEEDFHYGEIVGVTGGQISKEFLNADKYMVVSAAPAVSGAMPKPGTEDNYEQIAFVGQVPVKVRGEVHIGDYILPSGDGDGLAIAVHPSNMLAKDYLRIVGIAWENWNPEDRKKIYQMINTAVGINHNDLAHMIEHMQNVMNDMQKAIQEINPDYEGFVYETSVGNLKMDAGYSVSSTHDSRMEGYFDGIKYESREELGSIVAQAIEVQTGIDLGEYPVVQKILLDPEYAKAAEAHYSQLLEAYLASMNKMN